MANKSGTEAKKRSKFYKKGFIPSDVDLSPLEYLESGDITKVASELGEDANYVSKIKNGRGYNVRILSALLKKGRDNKKSLTEQ